MTQQRLQSPQEEAYDLRCCRQQVISGHHREENPLDMSVDLTFWWLMVNKRKQMAHYSATQLLERVMVEFLKMLIFILHLSIPNYSDLWIPAP